MAKHSSYTVLQAELAKQIAAHIQANPIDQPIEEIVIRWKAPLAREYSYSVEERPAQ